MLDDERNPCRRVERVGEILKQCCCPGNLCPRPEVGKDLVRLKSPATVRTCEQASARIQIHTEREGLGHPAVLQRPRLAAICGDIRTVIGSCDDGSEAREGKC